MKLSAVLYYFTYQKSQFDVDVSFRMWGPPRTSAVIDNSGNRLVTLIKVTANNVALYKEIFNTCSLCSPTPTPLTQGATLEAC